jgi:hypothetical protein
MKLTVKSCSNVVQQANFFLLPLPVYLDSHEDEAEDGEDDYADDDDVDQRVRRHDEYLDAPAK